MEVICDASRRATFELIKAFDRGRSLSDKAFPDRQITAKPQVNPVFARRSTVGCTVKHRAKTGFT
jgi:hypothetical protein